MKRFLVFLLVFSFSYSINAQMVRVNGYEQILSPKAAEDIPEDLKKIQYKKYLFQDYKPAYVDDFKERAFLRYNIFEDQMEFVKDDNIYYLKKETGRKIRFSDNTTYEVYGLNGKPQFFLVHVEGKNSLLSRQIVRFIEAREATSGYDTGKPADFKRRKDELYMILSDKGLVKVPTKKKEFYKIFGANSAAVKSHMKKNKLGYKKAKDLIKVVQFLNNL